MYFIGLFEDSIRKRMLSSHYTSRYIVRTQQMFIFITIITIIITYFSFMTVYPSVTEINGIMLPNSQARNQDDYDKSTKFGISHKISFVPNNNILILGPCRSDLNYCMNFVS